MRKQDFRYQGRHLMAVDIIYEVVFCILYRNLYEYEHTYSYNISSNIHTVNLVCSAFYLSSCDPRLSFAFLINEGFFP